MIDRIDSEMNLQRKALSLRSYRQELLASNIANSDTPYYKARDIDFKTALAGAVSSAGGDAAALQRTHANHLPSQDAGPYGAQIKYRTEYQGAVDGNTVNMDVERGAFTENSVQLEALLTFVRSSFKDMQTAIQGQ